MPCTPTHLVMAVAIVAWASARSHAARPESARLVASDAGSSPFPYLENFGASVALSGSIAVSVTLNHDGAYAFERVGAAWVQVAKLFPFGVTSATVRSVAVAGDELVMSLAPDIAPVRLARFRRVGQDWVQYSAPPLPQKVHDEHRAGDADAG